MAVFASTGTKVLIQGITGREGSMVAGHMLQYGTEVVAGVTPGRGGQQVHGVPVYDTVAEAIGKHDINCALVYVPPQFALDAAQEAMANGIRKLVIPTERIPRHDVLRLLYDANEYGVEIIGPNTVGVINPAARVKLGAIGGSAPDTVYAPGHVAIISRSGGMTSETAWMIKRAGYGVSEAFSVGGDALIGLRPHDLLVRLEADPDTKGVVMFSEPATNHEEAVATMLSEGRFNKPLIVYIAGRFTEQMPTQAAFGHVGAFLGRESGTPSAKEAVLRAAGALIVEEHRDIGQLLTEMMA